MKNKYRESYLKAVSNHVFNMDVNDVDDLSSTPQVIHPKFTNVNYIGIEIECIFSYDNFNNFLKELYIHNLDSKVMISDDGSIDSYSDDECSCELKLLTDEKNYKRDLKKLSECLRMLEAKVNKTCGLHVHLDTFNFNPNKLIQKINKYKSLFLNIIPKHRRENNYCSFENNYNNHYNWINKTSHGTIEVRCHEGTVNMKDVERFVTLLLQIKYINTSNKNNSLNNLKLSKGIKKYFKTRMIKFSNKSKGDEYYV